MNIIQDIIPKGNHNRPGVKIRPRYITVHDTANRAKGADARAHARYLKSGAGGREVSWHFTVDDEVIIQHLPLDEMGWHAGSGTGNRESIGIEICENEDGDRAKAEANAIELIRHLMKELGIPIDRVVPHQHWTGKYCPRNILPRWDEFLDRVKEGVKKPSKKPDPSKPATEYPGYLIKRGSRGEVVKAIQWRLGGLVVDGIYGPKTEARVKSFQAAWELAVDGIVGPVTWKALFTDPPYPGHLLKRGSRGGDVKKVQWKLGGLAVDGIFGLRTETRVKEFQRSKGLVADGIVGPKTWVALFHPEPKPAPKPAKDLHRVIVEGKQVGAYGVLDNLMHEVEKAVKAGAKKVVVEKV